MWMWITTSLVEEEEKNHSTGLLLVLADKKWCRAICLHVFNRRSDVRGQVQFTDDSLRPWHLTQNTN